MEKKLGMVGQYYQIVEDSLITSIVDNEEARYLECLIECNGLNLRIASVYVPNGQSIDSEAFKYNFLIAYIR